MRTSYYAFMSFYRKIVQSKELRIAVLKKEDDDMDVDYNFPEVMEVDNYRPNIKIEPEDDNDGENNVMYVHNEKEKDYVVLNATSYHNKTYHKDYYKKNIVRLKLYQKEYYYQNYVRQLLHRLNTGQQRVVYSKTVVRYGIYQDNNMTWKSKII